MSFTNLLLRLRALLSRERLNREIEDEIQMHLEFETRKHMQSGLAEDRARRRATIALGGRTRTLEDCREQRSIAFAENLLRDCRYAFRNFRRSPAFALAIIFTIAVAVGANTTVFSFCKAMLLATLPVPNPDQLHLFSIDLSGTPPVQYFSFPDLQQMQKTSNGSAVLTGFTQVVDMHLHNDSGTTSTIKGQLVALRLLAC